MPLSQLLTEIGEAYHGAQVGMYLMSWVTLIIDWHLQDLSLLLASLI